MTRLLHTLSVLAAGVWLGGMILVAIAAQSTFSVLNAEENLAQPNAVAGRVMAPTFSKFDKVQLICAVVLLIGTGAIAALAKRKLGPVLRLLAAGIATGFLIYSVQFLSPKIFAMQDDVAGAKSDSEIRAAFDEFHESAVFVSKVNLALVTFTLIGLAWTGPLRETVANNDADTLPTSANPTPPASN